MGFKLGQKIIDKLRGKKETVFCSNRIEEGNFIEIPKNIQEKISLNVIGKNNTIVCKNPNSIIDSTFNIEGSNNKIKINTFENFSPENVQLSIYGDNCEVELGGNLYLGSKLNLTLGQNHPFQGKITNSKIKIGKNCRLEGVSITTFNSNNTISIGSNCLFSFNVILYNTDGHPIYDKETNKLINYVKDMIIGDDCRIGYNATLFKGVKLPKGTIVGGGSVVASSFDKEYCAIAGNPAKIVRENVTWKRGGDMEYIKNEK